jgi:hypothetical protein
VGKGKRLKAKRKVFGNAPLTHAQEVLTRNFQKQIRESELWPQMVEEFGEAKAEELLKECKGEIKPGW